MKLLTESRDTIFTVERGVICSLLKHWHLMTMDQSSCALMPTAAMSSGRPITLSVQRRILTHRMVS